MKTIYLVTDGEYSDYHIIGAFSSEKKAEEYIAWHQRVHGDTSGPYIEEYPVNKLNTPDNVYYRARITEYHNGEHRTGVSCIILREPPKVVGVVTKEVHTSEQYPRFNCNSYTINLFTDSKERAIKIANEKIRQFQAEEQ